MSHLKPFSILQTIVVLIAGTMISGDSFAQEEGQSSEQPSSQPDGFSLAGQPGPGEKPADENPESGGGEKDSQPGFDPTGQESDKYRNTPGAKSPRLLNRLEPGQLEEIVMENLLIGKVRDGGLVVIAPAHRRGEVIEELFTTRMQEATAPRRLSLDAHKGKTLTIQVQHNSRNWGARIVEEVPPSTALLIVQNQLLLQARPSAIRVQDRVPDLKPALEEGKDRVKDGLRFLDRKVRRRSDSKPEPALRPVEKSDSREERKTPADFPQEKGTEDRPPLDSEVKPEEFLQFGDPKRKDRKIYRPDEEKPYRLKTDIPNQESLPRPKPKAQEEAEAEAARMEFLRREAETQIRKLERKLEQFETERPPVKSLTEELQELERKLQLLERQDSRDVLPLEDLEGLKSDLKVIPVAPRLLEPKQLEIIPATDLEKFKSQLEPPTTLEFERKDVEPAEDQPLPSETAF